MSIHTSLAAVTVYLFIVTAHCIRHVTIDPRGQYHPGFAFTQMAKPIARIPSFMSTLTNFYQSLGFDRLTIGHIIQATSTFINLLFHASIEPPSVWYETIACATSIFFILHLVALLELEDKPQVRKDLKGYGIIVLQFLIGRGGLPSIAWYQSSKRESCLLGTPITCARTSHLFEDFPFLDQILDWLIWTEPGLSSARLA